MATGGPRSSSDEEEELSFHDSDFDTSEESDVDGSTLTEEEKIVREKRHRRRALSEKEYKILAITLKLDPKTDRKLILQKTVEVLHAKTETIKLIEEEIMKIKQRNASLKKFNSEVVQGKYNVAEVVHRLKKEMLEEYDGPKK